MSPRRSLALSLEMGIKLRFGAQENPPFPVDRSPNVPYFFVLYNFPKGPFGRERSFLLCSTVQYCTVVYGSFLQGFFAATCLCISTPPSICAFCAIEKSHTTAHNLGKKEEKKEAKIRRIFLQNFLFFPRQSLRTYLRRGDVFWDASEFDCRLFSVKWAFPSLLLKEKNLSRSFDPPFFLHLFSRMKDEGKRGEGRSDPDDMSSFFPSLFPIGYRRQLGREYSADYIPFEETLPTVFGYPTYSQNDRGENNRYARSASVHLNY